MRERKWVCLHVGRGSLSLRHLRCRAAGADSQRRGLARGAHLTCTVVSGPGAELQSSALGNLCCLSFQTKCGENKTGPLGLESRWARDCSDGLLQMSRRAGAPPLRGRRCPSTSSVSFHGVGHRPKDSHRRGEAGWSKQDLLQMRQGLLPFVVISKSQGYVPPFVRRNCNCIASLSYRTWLLLTLASSVVADPGNMETAGWPWCLMLREFYTFLFNSLKQYHIVCTSQTCLFIILK